MKTLGAIIRMCYGIGLLLCIVALFFPEGNVFRELAIYILPVSYTHLTLPTT